MTAISAMRVGGCSDSSHTNFVMRFGTHMLNLGVSCVTEPDISDYLPNNRDT